jgi:hypothetical protein
MSSDQASSRILEVAPDPLTPKPMRLYRVPILANVWARGCVW